jgi:hypothetical protein
VQARPLGPSVQIAQRPFEEPDPTPGSPGVGRSTRVAVDLALLGLIGLCAGATTLSGGPARGVIVLVAALVVPGSAVMLRAGPSDLLSAAALAVAISLAIDTAVSVTSVWAKVWQPADLAIAIGVASAIAIADDLRRVVMTGSGVRRATGGVRMRAPLRWQLGLLAPLLIGLGACGASLHPVRLSELGQYGLLPVLPPGWYGGLALLVIGAVIAVSVRQSSAWMIGAFVVAIVVVLYATIPAISHDPQYAWLYKHVGVVRYIEAHGTVHPATDIYNRWPGFFAIAAVYSQLAGLRDPVLFAGWAELLFALVNALLVAAIAHTFVRDRRVVGLSVILFSALNWIGQGYFSPQGEAFALGLGVTLVVVRSVVHDPNLGRRAQLRIERILRCRQVSAEPRAQPGWSGLRSVLVILGIDAVIVVTHQLTPYVLVLQVGVLATLGFLRPRLTVVLVAALPVAFLAANLGFVESHYGLFTSFNPFANIGSSNAHEGAPVAGKLLNAHAGELLGVAGWVGAMFATAVLVRRGHGRLALCLAVLAFAPFVILLGQNYGGEAGLRVLMFSAPASATLIAWMIGELRKPIVRGAVTLAVVAAAVGLFIPSFFGTTELNLMPRDEVAASEYLYAHAPLGSVVVLADSSFPARVGPRYALFRGGFAATDPDLLADNTFRGRALGAGDIPAVILAMRQYPGAKYLVFSATQYEYAAIFRLTPPGALKQLQAAVAQSPHFKPFYLAPDVWIYRLIGRPAPPAAAGRP